MDASTINAMGGYLLAVVAAVIGYLRWRDERRLKEIEIRLTQALVRIEEQDKKIELQESEIKKLTDENVKFRVENAELRTRVEIFQQSVERQAVKA